MHYLLIDTSNQPMSVAITKDAQVLAEINSNERRNHSAQLMPAIARLFDEIDLVKQDIDRIVVAHGPGSYTGLRIGVTVAKTLAYALDTELYGVSSLKALAATIENSEARLIVPIFDARREAVYAGVYQYNDHQLTEILTEGYYTIEELLEKLHAFNQDYVFVGQDAVKLSDLLDHTCLERLPRAKVMQGLIDTPVPVHEFTPNYLKLSEAERNWQNQQNKN